jgi:hypothetical protein
VSRVCVCSRWALTSARVTGSWSICSCRRFQPVNARSDVHPDLLGSVEVVIADDARSVHRSVAPASPPEALARIVVRPALAWRRDRKLKGEPAAENLVLLRFDQLEWRGSVGGREQADEPAVHDGNTVPVVPQAAGAHSGHAVARCSIMQPGGTTSDRASDHHPPAELCRRVASCHA